MSTTPVSRFRFGSDGMNRTAMTSNHSRTNPVLRSAPYQVRMELACHYLKTVL